jgi:hypothetical protein
VGTKFGDINQQYAESEYRWQAPSQSGVWIYRGVSQSSISGTDLATAHLIKRRE